jgi:D-arabinose 5-phosphate isomerase GutQ
LPALRDDELIAAARTVVDADGRAVLSAAMALDEGFVAAARRLSTGTGKVLVTGSGTSGTVAARAAHLLSVCGTPAFYLSPTDGLHGGLGVLQPADLVLALSKGGSSEELNDFCRRAALTNASSSASAALSTARPSASMTVRAAAISSSSRNAGKRTPPEWPSGSFEIVKGGD